jgi:hypothetical protein
VIEDRREIRITVLRQRTHESRRAYERVARVAVIERLFEQRSAWGRDQVSIRVGVIYLEPRVSRSIV